MKTIIQLTCKEAEETLNSGKLPNGEHLLPVPAQIQIDQPNYSVTNLAKFMACDSAIPQNNKIARIKNARQCFGYGLKEAKEFIEEIMMHQGLR
jgi:ribosomal protein L7/L12